jgi:hypothetical protein
VQLDRFTHWLTSWEEVAGNSLRATDKGLGGERRRGDWQQSKRLWENQRLEEERQRLLAEKQRLLTENQ